MIAFVLLGAGFIFLAQSAAGQAERTELVVGLQNDMTTLDFFNPETNTVWNLYQVEWGFEGLFSNTPDYAVYPVLANASRNNGFTIVTAPTATTPGVIDVYVRPGVTFQDGQPMTADDVVFTYQVLAWSTYQTYITTALWWDAPRWAHWTGGTNVSHIGVEKVASDTVRFHLIKAYALFFLGTLEVPIIPKHIWSVGHINYAQQPINITSLKTITDSDDYSADFSFGSKPSETASTIGTGMFKFDSWSPNLGSHVSAYDQYWGKGKSISWGGTAYPFFPEHLRSIKFVIYTSLDVISLALQKGEIDTLIWSLTPGFLTQVRLNPAISVQTVTDAGYFYLSFNLRRKPWNDLNLRKAISMAIDKDYIVNTLMGGFGIKGNWPVSVHTASYVNASASLPSFDLNGAKALLNSVGIVDRNGDGFREYSDGSPIKTTILTPPKDYDPVRADAGIMISNNLKSIGLDIDAAPTSFDTIVAKAFTQVDFDIYILGWLLTGTPESYLTDFFHSKNDVAINPAGSNSAGLHDATVDSLLDKMETTLNDQTRIGIVKDIEGRVDALIPWNVLYYRKNLNAYRNDRWEGWVNTPPQLYNFWSLAKLRAPGAFTVPPSTGIFTVALTAPERALFGRAVRFDVFVSESFVPVSGATVWVNASYGGGGLALTGTTDAAGHVRFTWVVPLIQGNVVLTATAAKGGSKASTSKLLTIAVGPPAPVARLNLSTTAPVIGIGGTAAITATLVDGNGAAIPGVKVYLDRNVTLGLIAPSSAGSDVTSAAGKATFTYTAPSVGKFANQHLADFVKAYVNISNKVAADTQYASMVILVYNDRPPDWRIVTVAATDLNINTEALVPETITLTVHVTDFAGADVANKDVDPVLPSKGAWNVTVAPASAGSNRTSASGIATFTVTATTSARTGKNATTVPIRFQVRNDPFQVNDQVAVLLYNLTSSGGYAAKLDISTRAMPALDATNTSTTADVTITVTDKLGAPASNVPVIFQINYGPLGLPAQFPWDFDYGADYGLATYLGQGLDLNSFGAGSLGGSFESNPGQALSSLTYGVENFVEDYEVVGDWAVVDACDSTGNATIQNGVLEAFGALPLGPWPAGFDGTYIINVTSTTDALGKLTVPLTALPHRMDNGFQVKAYVGQLPGKKFNVTADACNFVAKINNYAFAIDSGMVISRAPVFGMGSAWFDQPAFTSQDEVATVHARFYTKDGPLADPEVFLLRGAGSAARNVGNLNTLQRASGAVFGTISAGSYPAQYSNNVLTWDVRDQFYRFRVFDRTTWPWTFHDVINVPLGASQTIYFAFVPADARFAYGGRDQMFAFDFGDYWFAPTFAALIAKIPFEMRLGYYFVPGGIYASVSVDKTLVPVQGTATATVTVTDDTGTPMAGASVFSGPFQNVTNATGQASFTFAAGTGAIENLVVASAPSGEVARAWYAIMASPPVLSYAVPTVTVKPAGQATTISVVVTNTVAVAGNATVLLSVGGTVVAAKVIAIGALGSQTVTFDYVFQSAGNYQVGVGNQVTTASIPAPPAPGVDYLLPVGLLVVGLVLGAVIGILLRRRGKGPPGMPAERGPETKAAEEELGPEENL